MRSKNVLHEALLLALIASSSLLVLSITYAPEYRYAYACTCGEQKSPLEESSYVDVVFAGRVTEVAMNDEIRDWVAEFEVERAWKGLDGNKTVYVNGDTVTNCGLEFIEDEKYLVYAVYFDSDEKTLLGTGACFRTSSIAYAQGDMQALDSAIVVRELTGFGGFPLLIGIGAAIAGIIAFFTLRKRK